MAQPLNIWCVTDGKPGHLSQLRGLLSGLARQGETVEHWLQVPTGSAARGLPRPDLILAAGHATHWPALRLKWRYGGKLVVLMKPSLPRFLFDLCVVPEHDGVSESPRAVATIGPLNNIRPSQSASSQRGLILIGGPSRHHDWSDPDMFRQLQILKNALSGISWTLTTSRRTPTSFVDSIESLVDDSFRIVPFEQTDQDWLLDHYGSSGVIWVSEDSASMVYEALTTGARVGVLAVPRHRESRVSRGLDSLVERSTVATLENVANTGEMPTVTAGLAEADRVAEYILQMFELGVKE